MQPLAVARLLFLATLVVGLIGGSHSLIFAQEEEPAADGAGENDSEANNEESDAEIDPALREELLSEEAVRHALEEVVLALLDGDDAALAEFLSEEDFATLIAEMAENMGYEDVEAFRERHFTLSGAWGEHWEDLGGLDFEIIEPLDADGEARWYEDTPTRPMGHGWLEVQHEEEPYTISFLFVIDPEAGAWRLARYHDAPYFREIAAQYTEAEESDDDGDVDETAEEDDPEEPTVPEVSEELREALMNNEAVEAALDAVLSALLDGENDALDGMIADEAFRINVIGDPAAELNVSPERFRAHYFSASEGWGDYIRELELEVDPELGEEEEPIWYMETPEGPRGIGRVRADDGEAEPYHIYFVFAIDPEAEGWRLINYDDVAYEPWWMDPIDPDPEEPSEPDVTEEPAEPEIPEIEPFEVGLTEDERRRHAVVLQPTVPAELAEAMTEEQQRAYADAVLGDVAEFDEFTSVELLEVAVDEIDVFLRELTRAANEGEPFEYNGTVLGEEEILTVLAAGYGFTIKLEDVEISTDEEPYEVEVEMIEVELDLEEPLEFPEGYEELPAELRAKLSYEVITVPAPDESENGNEEENGNNNGEEEGDNEANDNGEEANDNGEEANDNGEREIYRFRFVSPEPMIKEELDALIDLAPMDDNWQLAVFDLSEMSEEAEPVMHTETRTGPFLRLSYDVNVNLYRIDVREGDERELVSTPVDGGRWSFAAQGRQEAEEYLLIEGSDPYEEYLATHGPEAIEEETARREAQALGQALREAARTMPEGLAAALRALEEFLVEEEPDPDVEVRDREGVREIADEGKTIIAAVREVPALDATVGILDDAGDEQAVGRVRRIGADVTTREAPEGMTWVELQRFRGEAQRNWQLDPYGILGFQFDAGIGVDFALGHDRSEVFPMIPDPDRKQITDAAGSGFFSLHLGYNFGRLIGAPPLSEFYIGVDAQLGFGGFYRYSKIGGRISKKFYVPVGNMMLSLNLGVSIGALQHSAGGQDITDVTFFMLTDRKGIPAEQAREETAGQRITSDWLFYTAIKPRIALWLIPEFEVYFSMGVLFTPTTSEFRLGDRRFNADDPDLQVPGFEWYGIGFQITLGGVLHF